LIGWREPGVGLWVVGIGESQAEKTERIFLIIAGGVES